MSDSTTFVRSGALSPPRFEQTPDMQRDRAQVLARAVGACGDVVQLRFRTRDFYFFAHPDAIQRILVTNHRNYPKGPDHIYLKPVIGNGLITSEGSFHLQQRRAIQPAFHRARIGAYVDMMTSYTVEMMEAWKPGATLDLTQEMLRLTMRIIVATLFGLDIQDTGDALSQEVRRALALFSGEARTLLPAARRASRELDDVLYRIIGDRRAEGRDRGDLLSVLLAAGDGAMSDRQVRDEVMTLFFAGHDTSASALSWTWSLLAAHPEAQLGMRAELDDILGDRLPTLDDVSRLQYTTMAFAEALRLYPPVWSISRETLADDVVCGFHVPAGMPVMVSPYVTQRDARFFPEPDRFDPLRFHPDDDVRKRLPRFAYFPFGGGVRQCMGDQFAWMEAALLMATVVQRYRLAPAEGHTVAPEARITLRPKDGVWVTLGAW